MRSASSATIVSCSLFKEEIIGPQPGVMSATFGDDELSAGRVCSKIQIARSAGQGNVWGELSDLWHVTLQVELG